MKEKKVNKKVFYVIIGSLIMCLLIICIHTIRNSIIINELYKKQEALKEINNYYYISEHYTENNSGDKNTIEHYYKDGIDKLILNNGNIVMWYNNNSKENIVIDIEQKIADITSSEYLVGSDFPIYIDETKKSIGTYIGSKITKDEIDGTECYKIDSNKQTIWITKQEGIVLKAIDKTEDDYEVVEYKEWKTDTLKNEDVERPDLDGYEIIE